jgi:molybdopterin-guanine dinucleotide biosynthesis protein A
MGNADPTLAILAGGAGMRMGGAKSALVVGSQPILTWLHRRLGWGGPTLLVTAPGNRAPAGAECFDREVVDPVDGAGPVQGIITALRVADTRLLVVAPVDMPLLRREQLQELAAALLKSDWQGIACTRRVDGKTLVEPFPCAFRSTAFDVVMRYFHAGQRSLRGLCDAGICGTFDATDWPDETWTNLNTPDDLARFSQAHG